MRLTTCGNRYGSFAVPSATVSKSLYAAFCGGPSGGLQAQELPKLLALGPAMEFADRGWAKTTK